MCQGNCERFEKMNKQNKPCVSNRPSIYYWWRPNERISSELADFVLENDTSNTCYAKCSNSKDSSYINEPKSSEILSTIHVISIFGQVLSLASRPLTFFQPKKILNQENDGSNEVIFNNVVKVDGKAVTSPEIKKFNVDIRTDSPCSPRIQPTFGLGCLRVTQKMSMLESCKNHSMSSFWSLLHGGNDMFDKSWKGKCLATIQISHYLGEIYHWMNHTSHIEACYPVKVVNAESMEANVFKARGGLNVSEGYISGDSSFLVNELINETSKNAPMFQYINLSSLFIQKLEVKMMENVYMASPILTFVQDNNANGSIQGSPDSDILVVHSLPSKDGALDNSDYRCKIDSNDRHENKTKQSDKFIVENEYKRDDCSLTREKSCYIIAKQEHAFAGALAGVFVSLCLHPVDTIKTVVQSYHAEQKSLSYIGKSIVSDRGLSGLYRGISTNIASSAPISAVYTFTYESVKGALLPLFQEEYRSIVHCVAGGYASIATSFIFTPSERIKQQMQVSSHYHNCWNAFFGVVAKGGLRGLYTGWGAVLCRNVPHSVIKFYTYESLKELMKSNSQQTTTQTLVCGGVAGSTAALFTTPFDVVKTRLQTQIPGSLSPYKNVIQALYEIGKKEGLKGLYRGLTPRLVMYLSQGAIFFASYEFLKRLFSLEEPQRATERVQCQSDKKLER